MCAGCLLFEHLRARLSWWPISLSRWPTSYSYSDFGGTKSWPYIENFTAHRMHEKVHEKHFDVAKLHLHGNVQTVLIYSANEENVHSVDEVSCKPFFLSQKIYWMRSFVIDAIPPKLCRSRIVSEYFWDSLSRLWMGSGSQWHYGSLGTQRTMKTRS